MTCMSFSRYEPINGVPQPHLYQRRLDIGAIAYCFVEDGGRWMVAKVLPHAGQVMDQGALRFPPVGRGPHS